MSLNTTFTVLHKNKEAQEQLGLGIVVGDFTKNTNVQYQGSIVKEGKNVPAVITEVRSEILYQVLWENARDVSPSIHKSTDLVWVDVPMLADDADDDEEGEEEEELENSTGDAVDVVETDSIDFGSDVVQHDAEFSGDSQGNFTNSHV